MEGKGIKRSRMTVGQFVWKDEQQDDSWHFTICKQCRDFWQCFTTHTGSRVLGLYKLPTGVALQFTECPSTTVFSQLSDNTSAAFWKFFSSISRSVFFQKNQNGYQNRYKEERYLPNHEKEVPWVKLGSTGLKAESPAVFTSWSKMRQWTSSWAPSVSINKIGLRFTNYDWNMSRTSKACLYAFDVSIFPLLMLIKLYSLCDTSPVLVISHNP